MMKSLTNSCHLLVMVCGIFLSAIGCSKGFKLKSDLGSEHSLYKESTSQFFIPNEDRLISNCHLSEEMCLYLINPMAHSGSVIQPNDHLKLQAAQNFSVRLTGVDYRSGRLRNKNFRISSIDRNELPISEVIQSRGFDKPGQMVHFINTYYWLNRASEYLSKNFKRNPMSLLEGENYISVFVNDGFDGWSLEHRSIHLNKFKNSALSADVILVLLGEALASLSSKGEVHKGSDICTNTQCGLAILSGVGSAFFSMLVPDQPLIGQFHSQDLTGQKICGRERSVLAFKNVTFRQAFDFCDSSRKRSQAMGLVYASIWFEVRAQGQAQKVDQLFLDHLSQLSGLDDFQSVLMKIQNTALQTGSESLIPLFQNEFARRL